MSTIISFRLFIKVLIKLDLLPYLIPFSNLELLALDCGTLLLVACLLFAALVVWWCLTMFWMCVVSIVCVAVGVSRLAPSIGLVCAEFIFSWALGLYTYGLYSLDFYLCLFVQFRSCNAFKKITDKKISKLYWEKKKNPNYIRCISNNSRSTITIYPICSEVERNPLSRGMERHVEIL